MANLDREHDKMLLDLAAGGESDSDALRRCIRAAAGQVFIYGLFDPRDNSLRYIGQSVDPSARMKFHESTHASSSVAAWISELDEQSPIVRILEACSPSSADEAEIRWIDVHKPPLNKRTGGRFVPAGTERTKIAVSARLSQRACDLVDGLSSSLGLSKNQVVEMALEALLREHPIAELAKPKEK